MQYYLEEKPTLKVKIKRYINECIRVIRVTKKPTKEEFKIIFKVSGMGMMIIGLIGFIIEIVKELLITV